jgi:DNA invertase Pin-like site-specific DNA recombinase
MTRVGYARVSTREQDLTVQLEKLKGCDKIYEEKLSGTHDKRPKLNECLDYVREGDTLVVTRLDRLARSTLHLCEISKLLERKGVSLVVIDQSLDTGTSSGRLLFNMLGAIAQFETEIRSERQAEGIRKALSKGVKFGRKSLLNADQAEVLRRKRREGVTISALMSEFGLGKVSVYNYLRKQ